MKNHGTLCMLALVCASVFLTGCGKDVNNKTSVTHENKVAESKTQMETQVGKEVVSKVETQSQPETMAKVETQTQPETMAKVETQAQTETMAKEETQTQPETMAKVETQAQQETQAQTETQVNAECIGVPTKKEEKAVDKIYLTVNGKKLGVTLAKNSSVDALVSHLKNAPITYQAHDYGGFEKVGDLGISLPRNDENITTKAGDVILYQGTSLCIYYNQNNWDFTRIGWIDGLSGSELKNVLGNGNVTVTISID